VTSDRVKVTFTRARRRIGLTHVSNHSVAFRTCGKYVEGKRAGKINKSRPRGSGELSPETPMFASFLRANRQHYSYLCYLSICILCIKKSPYWRFLVEGNRRDSQECLNGNFLFWAEIFLPESRRVSPSDQDLGVTSVVHSRVSRPELRRNCCAWGTTYFCVAIFMTNLLLD